MYVTTCHAVDFTKILKISATEGLEHAHGVGMILLADGGIGKRGIKVLYWGDLRCLLQIFQ